MVSRYGGFLGAAASMPPMRGSLQFYFNFFGQSESWLLRGQMVKVLAAGLDTQALKLKKKQS